MAVNNWKSLVLGAAVLTGCALGGGQPAESAQEAGPVDLQLAVVDYKVLISAHPDYDKLKQVDERIDLLQQEKIMAESRARELIYSKAGEDMASAIKEGQAELEAEKAAIDRELGALSSALGAQLEREMGNLQSAYERELEDKLKPYKNQAPAAVTPPPVQQQVTEYQQNLALVRERNLAAKRLELEKKVNGEMQAERARLDSQLAAYEDELSSKYQTEKLNLQLKVQNASSEEERTAAEARLTEISEELAAAKEARRAEIEGGFAGFRSERQNWVEQELASYKKTLDVEFASKMSGQVAAATKVTPAATKAEPPPQQAAEIKAKIAQIESSMQAEFARKKASLKARMEAETAEARERLMAKQKEVTEKIRAAEEEIKARIDKEMANLADEDKAELKEVEKQIEEAQKQRDELYDLMKEELNKEVATVAEKKNAPMVIGYFVVNRNCSDLTDSAMVAVKQIER